MDHFRIIFSRKTTALCSLHSRVQSAVRRASRSYEQCTFCSLRVNPQLHPQAVQDNQTYESVACRISPPSTIPTPIPTSTTVSFYATYLRRRTRRLDHYRVITFKDFSHKAIVRQSMLNVIVGDEEHRSSLIMKQPAPAFLEQNDISR